ncbi:NAD(P)H-hydrate epimerase, partial [Trichinella sp. T8]
LKMMNSNLQQHKQKPWSSPLRRHLYSRATAHNIEAQLVNKYCFSVDQLMELRGKACANAILKFYPPVHAMSNYKRVMVVCGPDNNGGNGLNYEPLIIYAAKPKTAIMKRLLSQAREFQIPIFETTDDIDWSHVDLIIDAVQGLYSNPPVKKPYKQIVASIIGFVSIPVVSIDVPSGWHADEGPIGPDAVQPTCLISLTVPKKCAEKFLGEIHLLAGRFVPKTLDKQYELHIPPYPKDHDYVLLQLCEQKDKEFNHLLMHTEVRWLSKGACLSCFYELFETILEFFQNKDPSLRDSLKKCKSGIAYMADLFSRFNEHNLQLQGSELNLIKTRSVISSFISKLALFKRNLGRRKLYQFPKVAALKENGEVHDDDIQIYCDHLDVLQKDMQEKFQDILKMKILNWVIDLFSNTDEIEMELEEELIDLQTNKEIELKFKNRYHSFWLQKQISDLYHSLWRMVRKFLLAFPSSYLVERGFSVVTDFPTKKESDCKSPNVVIYDCSLPTLNPMGAFEKMATGGSDIYMAECIMNERKRKGKKEYLVRWEGYSEKYDTWEPASHILGYELLQEYNEAKKNGFKNAFEHNKHKENQLGKSAAKKSKKESNAPSTKNAGEQVRRKDKSGSGKQNSELNVSGDDKEEDASVENQEAEGKEESEAANRFCEWIRQLPLSMNSGPSPGLYSRSNLTIGEFEEKMERYLQLLRNRKQTSLMHKPNKN